MCQLIKYHPAICAVRLHLVHRESYLTTKQGGNIENNGISIYLIWHSKPKALKRESLLNTFADECLNTVDIRTKYNIYLSNFSN